MTRRRQRGDGSIWPYQTKGGTRTNTEWWAWKVARNTARDQDTDQLLTEAGWTVVRVWEHEPIREAADRIVTALRQTASTTR